MSPRDRRFSKTHGTKPFSGHRFVEDGKVKIEFGRRRRTITVSDVNTKAERERADDILREALAEARARAEGRRLEVPGLTLAGLLVRHREDAVLRVNGVTQQRLRRRTLALYAEQERAILRELEPTTPAAVLRKAHVRQMVMSLRQRGLAEGTIARLVAYLKAVYRWAVGEMELLEVDPIAGAKGPSRQGNNPPYTPDEGRQLLEALFTKTPARAWRFRLTVLVESVFGVRAHQVLHLRWPDVDFDRLFEVAIPDGRRVALQGVVTFRQATMGSKGQPDRTLPLVPLVREAFLEAHNHRREESAWVLWNWRHADRPVRYDSMAAELHKLERRAGVVTVKGRAFHAFRRALATALVEQLGVSAASAWIADRPEVLLRRYLKPTDQAQASAALYLLHRWNSDPKQQGNRNDGTLDVAQVPATFAATGTYGTGPAGIEPATSGYEIGPISDKSVAAKDFPPEATV